MFGRQFVAAAVSAAIFALASPASAQDYKAGELKISKPWARATPAGAQVGGGFMTITNTGKVADRLIGGSSAVAGRVEIHEMAMENNVMKMRALGSGLEIKPGATVELKPGGYHVMFMQLKQGLEAGKPFKGTLVFEKAGKVDVDFSVQSMGAGGMQMQHGSHH